MHEERRERAGTARAPRARARARTTASRAGRRASGSAALREGAAGTSRARTASRGTAARRTRQPRRTPNRSPASRLPSAYGQTDRDRREHERGDRRRAAPSVPYRRGDHADAERPPPRRGSRRLRPGRARFRGTTRPSSRGLRAASCARSEAEQPLGARGVELPARLAVRHRGVPDDLAVEAGHLGDRLGELADRRLDTGAEVDRLRPVVALGGEQQPVGAVVDVEELAGRRAVAPEHDLAGRRRASCGSGPGSRATVCRSKLSRGP